MIKLDIDKDKILTIAMVPYVPTPQIIEMSTGLQGDFDKIKFLTQIQIMNAKNLEVIAAVVLTPDEVSEFSHLLAACGKSNEELANVLDKRFEGYREIVRRHAQGQR